MKTVLEHIRDHLQLPEERNPTYNEMIRSEWSRDFEWLMRRRLIMGRIRYKTPFRKAYKGQRKHDVVKSAIDRLKLYEKTGNTEHLVDAANCCMIEYNSPLHKNAHFESIDDGIHVEETKK